MKPSIGRIVHFYDGESGPYPAIITKVWTDTCINLVVFGHPDNVIGKEFTSVMSDNTMVWNWIWPPKV